MEYENLRRLFNNSWSKEVSLFLNFSTFNNGYIK